MEQYTSGDPYSRRYQKERVAASKTFLDEGFTWESDLFKDPMFQAYRKRPELVQRYAWAIPNEKALSVLLKHSPLIEIGAGTGYWAHLLQKRGADILAFDTQPPDRTDNHYHPLRSVWTRVEKGGAKTAERYPARALFLCWPPYESPMAYEALNCYRGDTVIYVGEGNGGCTGDDRFHELLEEKFEEVESVKIPKWPGIHDNLTVFKRR